MARRPAVLRTNVLALLALVLGLGALAPSASVEADPPAASASRTRRRAAPRRGRARRPVPRITAAQRRQIRRWHARAPGELVRRWQSQEPPPLVLRPLASTEPFALVPQEDGRFAAPALALAEEAFRHRIDGSHGPIHPRLLELVYRAARHFHAPYVHVISGYRSGNPSSRHGQGRAIDLVLPGVPDRRLAAYLRPQGYVGVGIYPISGFVHLDVRARSYFWADASGPGQRNRERRIMRTLGPRFDRIARALGAEPVPDIEDTHEEETDEASPVEVETAGVSEPTVSEPGGEEPSAEEPVDGVPHTEADHAERPSDGGEEAAYAAPP